MYFPFLMLLAFLLSACYNEEKGKMINVFPKEL